MFDAFAPPNALKDFGLLVLAVLWNEDSDRLADKFFACITEEALGTWIQSGYNAIKVLAENSIVGELDDRRQALCSILDFLAIGYVDQCIHGTGELTCLVP